MKIKVEILMKRVDTLCGSASDHSRKRVVLSDEKHNRKHVTHAPRLGGRKYFISWRS